MENAHLADSPSGLLHFAVDDLQLLFQLGTLLTPFLPDKAGYEGDYLVLAPFLQPHSFCLIPNLVCRHDHEGLESCSRHLEPLQNWWCQRPCAEQKSCGRVKQMQTPQSYTFGCKYIPLMHFNHVTPSCSSWLAVPHEKHEKICSPQQVSRFRSKLSVFWDLSHQACIAKAYAGLIEQGLTLRLLLKIISVNTISSALCISAATLPFLVTIWSDKYLERRQHQSGTIRRGPGQQPLSGSCV